MSSPETRHHVAHAEICAQYLRNCSTDPEEYTAALKLLQDLCSRSGQLPSSYLLENVTFDRRDVIGKGGEVSVYQGTYKGREVAVREVVMPRSFWCLPDGKDSIRVILIRHVNVNDTSVN